MRKILLFAALGTLGALVGAMIGEPGFRLARDWAKSFAPQGRSGTILSAPEPPQIASPIQRQRAQADVAAPEPPPPPKTFAQVVTPEPPPPPAEFASRLQRENAQTGDVQVSLLWNNAADLDLECVDPLGELVFVTHPSSSGGTLDVDMNGTVPGIPTRKTADKPVENIFWSKGKAPPGRYRVYVANSDLHGTSQPTRYEVNVLANGQRKTHVGSIRFAGHKRHPVRTQWLTGIARDLVCEFEVEAPRPPAPELAISVPRRMDVAPAGTNRFQVRIARGFFEGDVRIELLDCPSDLEAHPVAVPRSASEGTLAVRAQEDAQPGERVVKVLASAETPMGPVRAEGTVLLAVKPPVPVMEPVLKLSVPERIDVERGGAATFKVRIGRWYFPKPVTATVRLAEGSEGSLTSDAIQLVPATDVGTLEIHVRTTAPMGVQTVRVMARAESPFDAHHVEQSVQIAIVEPPPQTDGAWWPMALAAGGWTAFVGLGLSLLLVVGQNGYLGRKWLGGKQASLLVPGAVLAGGVAGAMGQASASWMAEAATVGHFAGWLLLGALLGRGVAFFVPNLKGLRATAAGATGGLLGATALLAGTHGVGEIVGRGLGAGTLGLAIGAMVAWVELACRSAWLECRYGPRETVSVNLGATPVGIGSDTRICTVYARGARALAGQYKLNASSQVVFLDYSTERETLVPPGYERTFGAVTITVRTSSTAPPATINAPRPPPAPPPPAPRRPPTPPRPNSDPKQAVAPPHVSGSRTPPPPPPSRLPKSLRPPPPPPSKG